MYVVCELSTTGKSPPLHMSVGSRFVSIEVRSEKMNGRYTDDTRSQSGRKLPLLVQTFFFLMSKTRYLVSFMSCLLSIIIKSSDFRLWLSVDWFIIRKGVDVVLSFLLVLVEVEKDWFKGDWIFTDSSILNDYS